MQGLLVREPAQRLTANQALEHPWIKDQRSAPTKTLNGSVVSPSCTLLLSHPAPYLALTCILLRTVRPICAGEASFEAALLPHSYLNLSFVNVTPLLFHRSFTVTPPLVTVTEVQAQSSKQVRRRDQSHCAHPSLHYEPWRSMLCCACFAVSRALQLQGLQA